MTPQSRLPLLIVLQVALFPLIASGSDPEPPQVLASWVQYTADGVEVRVVTTGTCPLFGLDGQSRTMQQRAAPTDRHPNRVCSARVPTGTSRIQLQDTALPAPLATTLSRIVVLGDTGCRVSAKHGLYQACNNSSIWPFSQVADSAGRTRPDLIIHTGDYLYRESPCPGGNKGCEGTPWGDNQETWMADWFAPSAALRAAAPLVFLRGNHENCARAGLGWFRYLDAHPFTGKCEHTTDPWVMRSGAVQVAVLDTSELKDGEGRSLTLLYADQLKTIKTLLSGPAWIATHRPFWGFGADDDTGLPVQLTRVLQDAVRETGLPEQTRLLIGAHLHLAEALTFDEQRPPQLVIGNGGTELVPITPPPDEIDGLPITTREVLYQYGFTTMDRVEDNGWNITFLDRIGRTIRVCLFSDNAVACDTAAPRTD